VVIKTVRRNLFLARIIKWSPFNPGFQETRAQTKTPSWVRKNRRVFKTRRSSSSRGLKKKMARIVRAL
jgi:hypothetical protein